MQVDSEIDHVEAEVLDTLMGHAISGWHLGDGGIHFDLDDGRVVIFAGVFILSVLQAEEPCLH